MAVIQKPYARWRDFMELYDLCTDRVTGVVT